MDLNGDGNRDLFGAGFAGFPYILYGNKDGSFNEAVILKDKSGTNINIGKYWDSDLRKYVKLGIEENEDKGNFAKAHDWDNDGDLDLIISGHKAAKVRINVGSKINPVFATNNIDIFQGYHADAMIDWDGDGLWDILGGASKGGVYFLKNIGTLGSPSFAEAECLIDPASFIEKTNGGNCGMTELAVADYNDDGKLDLIFGSRSSVNIPEPVLTETQIMERDQLKIEKKLISEISMEFYKKFKKEYGTSKTKMREAMNDDEVYQLVRKKYSSITERLNKLIARRASFGYVWVSLRD